MKTKDFATLGFIVLLTGVILWLWMSPSGQMNAPEVSFTDLKGSQFNMDELKGKPVVINFWATTCPGCVKEIPVLNDLFKQYQSQDLIIIGVAMDYDPEAQVREMVRKKNMNYQVVLDSNGEIARAFGNVSLTPTTFFINRHGLILKHKLGEMNHSELELAIQSIVL
jgi:peroxiredoxin